MMRHFPEHALHTIPPDRIAKASTNHNSNPIMRKRIGPMKHLKKLCADPSPLIEHSLKIQPISENVPMPRHDVGKNRV